MSDMEKPAEPPAQVPLERTPRPEAKPEKPPVLTDEQGFGPSIRLRDFEADIERELQEAMGGLSNKDLYGEPAKGKPAEGAPGQGAARKKGKVIAVRGADVFVQVPGGRSEGVLPLQQFEESPP